MHLDGAVVFPFVPAEKVGINGRKSDPAKRDNRQADVEAFISRMRAGC